MIFHRGDVVLVQFPFSSGAGGKMRPALVVQADGNNQRLMNVILAAITTTTHRVHEATQLFLDVSSPTGRRSGLLFNSAVTCENLATISSTLVKRRIGDLTPELMFEVNNCLRRALDL